MKPIMTILAVILSVVIFACAGSKPRPEEAQTQTYDAKKYLTAEASGPTQGEAKRAAMAALAGIFHSRVRAETQTRANSYITEAKDEQFEKQVDQLIQVETDVQLEGAQIGWVHPDKEAGGFSALAVLDRDQAAGRWRRELERIESELDAGTSALPAVKGRLPRLIALNRLAALMGQMALTESRLSVLGRPAMPYDTDLTAILTERQQLLQQATFFLQINGEVADLFSHRLGALITAQGYLLAKSADQAAGLITGKLYFQPLALDNPDAKFVRALADLSIVDQDTGSEIAAFSENVRKGHMDENEARRRGIDQLAQQAADKIAQAMGSLGVEAVAKNGTEGQRD
ncbi:MAG: hypothetical protein M0036_14460 [Desulfobacteraceae bacterium]|nr:hypothetical protein [Desulfobacteraceae bacterium]